MKTIIPDDEASRCYLCGRYGPQQVHHMLHGSHRKNADYYGLTVHLCPDCHRKLHDEGENDLFLEKQAQRVFEHKFSREDFWKVFGRYWL